jgi:hypothetical protein
MHLRDIGLLNELTRLGASVPAGASDQSGDQATQRSAANLAAGPFTAAGLVRCTPASSQAVAVICLDVIMPM